MYSKYSKIKEYIRDRVPFRGNSVYAILHGGEYEVYSYDTLIYKVGYGDEYFNTKKYSRTTSRLQNIIKEIIE